MHCNTLSNSFSLVLAVSALLLVGCGGGDCDKPNPAFDPTVPGSQACLDPAAGDVSANPGVTSTSTEGGEAGGGLPNGEGGGDGTDWEGGGHTDEGGGSTDEGGSSEPLQPSCGDIYTCTENCDFDSSCASSCIASGSPKSQSIYDDLVTCVENCTTNHEGAPPSVSSCLEYSCDDELQACLEDTGEAGSCGDGYCMDYEKEEDSDGQFVGNSVCLEDCSFCGDYYCAESENFETNGGNEYEGYCVADCGFCGDGICTYEGGEGEYEVEATYEANYCEKDCICYGFEGGEGIDEGLACDSAGL